MELLLKIVKGNSERESTKHNELVQGFVFGAQSCKKLQFGSPTVKKRLPISAVSNKILIQINKVNKAVKKINTNVNKSRIRHQKRDLVTCLCR